MKILAVRGENLASLVGPFELDLEEGILGQVGLFAITGPTGSGKSTLLDAICLCLYDKTPRLATKGGNTVRLEGVDDETALRANDQRNILRRGAVACWAEVDFTGRDGQGYTARWEVHRSRRSVTGSVQPQKWSLRRLGDDTGQVVAAGKKGEVEAAIQQRVGLDFEQFQRSVLLAQGDFAAFLQASEPQRAMLLEQMTGSEIYTHLSKAAFQKKRTLEQARQKLEIQLGEHAVLDADARTAADAALVAAGQRRQRAELVEKSATAAVSWHTEDKRLTAQLEEAETEHTQAALAVTQAAPRRSLLEAWSRAWPLRALAADARTATTQAGRTQAAASQAQATAQRAQQALALATQAHGAARGASAGAWASLADQLESRLDRARTARTQLNTWLSDHRALARLVESDSQLRLLGSDGKPGKLDKRVELATGRHHLQTILHPQRTAELAKAHEQLNDATTKRSAAQAALTAISSQSKEAHTAVLAIQAKLPSGRATALAAHRQAHTALSSVVVRAEDTLQQRQSSQKQAATMQVEANRALAASTAATQAAAETQLLLNAAEKSLQRARAAADAEGLRQLLVSGEPCSVCGSTEHPWADGSPLAAVFKELEQAVVEHRTTLDANRRTQTEAETRHAAALEAIRLAQAQVTSADQKIMSLSVQWSTASMGLPADRASKIETLGDHMGDAARPTPLDLLHQSLVTEEASLKADQVEERRRRAVQDQQQAAERRALAARDGAVAAHEAAALALPARKQAMADVEREIETLTERIAAMEAELCLELDPLASELDPTSAIVRWRDHLGAPAPVLSALQLAQQQVARKRRRIADATGVVDALISEAPVAHTQARHAKASLPDGMSPTPLSPPDGMTPPDQTSWLRQRTLDADHTTTTTQGKLQEAETVQRGAKEQSTAADAAHRTQAAAAGTAGARLQEQCQAHSLDDDALKALCALNDQWPHTERAQLDALGQRMQTATAVVLERKKRCLHHLDQRPKIDASTAEAQLEAAQVERADSDEAWSTNRVRIARDDQARKESTQLHNALLSHDAGAEAWLKLADCIGSASGQELRKYAQSLTLELLLDQANAHLRRLHPRYRLARIAGTDLDILIIDGDLGDEARTIRSLSGGEGFLVSLALALGLSSLSARDVRVESLFIDEGFGTLDASSLDKALSVLDSLQSEGRQVGIISHVSGLAERIGVRVAVEPQGGGRSTVRVISQ